MANNLAGYGGNPLSVPRDEVRFLAGDRDPNGTLVTDAEIDYCLAKRGNNPLLAAELAIVAMLATIAQSGDESVGPVSVSNTEIYDNLTKQLVQVRTLITLEGGCVYVGGLNPGERFKDIGTTVRPAFTTTMLEPRYDRGTDYGGPSCGWINPLLTGE